MLVLSYNIPTAVRAQQTALKLEDIEGTPVQDGFIHPCGIMLVPIGVILSQDTIHGLCLMICVCWAAVNSCFVMSGVSHVLVLVSSNQSGEAWLTDKHA